MKKTIKRIVKGQQVSDGAGVRLNRVIASAQVNNIDPFFLLDEFRSDNPNDYLAGFPMHPHRGIETITYMLRGSFQHKDSRGGGGVLKDGEVQWMTAGKGIQHEEMPAMEKGHLWGYQLWLNLPKRDKMVEPKYQHLTADKLPVVEKEGVKVLVISGEFQGALGPAQNYVPSTYLDVYLEPGKVFGRSLDKEQNSLIYVHTGEVSVDGQVVTNGNLVEFEPGATIELAGGKKGAGLLFLSGKPNNEPFARGGPFIMNTREEIEQAFEDYQNGILF